jgi:hypothetical protein
VREHRRQGLWVPAFAGTTVFARYLRAAGGTNGILPEIEFGTS